MTLTKEDLAAIRGIVVEELTIFEAKIEAKIDDKLEPIREALKELLKVQIGIVDKVDYLEVKVNLLIQHNNLSEESRALRKTLKKFD